MQNCVDHCHKLDLVTQQENFCRGFSPLRHWNFGPCVSFPPLHVPSWLCQHCYREDSSSRQTREKCRERDLISREPHSNGKLTETVGPRFGIPRPSVTVGVSQGLRAEDALRTLPWFRRDHLKFALGLVTSVEDKHIYQHLVWPKAVFNIEALIWVLFLRLLKFQLFSWRVDSNPRCQSKSIEMEYKTHIKLVHDLYDICFQYDVKN